MQPVFKAVLNSTFIRAVVTYGILAGIIFLSFDTAAEESLTVAVSRNSLKLGFEKSLKVTAGIPGGNVKSKFKLTAAYGTVKNIEIDDKGHITALYIPPEQFFPAVDVIAIGTPDNNSDTINWSYTIVKLIGEGSATIKTSPGAVTFLRIENQKFGPVRADKKGVALVNVEVPPGVNRGVDAKGKIVDLGLPVLSTAVVFVYQKIPVDAENESELDLMVVMHTSKGQAYSGTLSPVLTARKGRIINLQKRERFFTAKYVAGSRDTAEDIISAAGNSDEPPYIKTLYFKLTDTSDSSAAANDRSVEKSLKSSFLDMMFMGVSGGVSWDFSDWLAGIGAVDVGFRLPAGLHQLGIGLSGRFSGSLKESDVTDPAGETLTIKERFFLVPITGFFWYRWSLTETFRLTVSGYLGAAVAMHQITLSAPGALSDTQRNQGVMFTGAISLGCEIMAGPGAFTVQLQEWFSHGNITSFDNTLINTEILLGYRFFIFDK